MLNHLFILRILFVTLFFEFLSIKCSTGGDKLVIELSNGKVEGHLVKNADGSEGWAFLGIPYAEQPVGRLRFAKPEWRKSWKGILPCHQYKSACWQNTSGSGEFEEEDISEDCLYANILVGHRCVNKSFDNHRYQFDRFCPVIYYIHGGGYEFDSPRMFKPEVWIRNFTPKDIIIVTLAYRLNVFGFWSSGTDEAMGNWALHDMIHGAKWIQKEIERFGGDASRVTVQGHSSSAMAISLLTLSPKTEGLFHQAIMMSGTSFKRDGAISNNVSDFGELAVILNCSTWSEWENRANTIGKILNCLRELDASTVGNAFRIMRGNSTATGDSARITLPRIDGPKGLFPDTMEVLLAERRPLTTVIGTVKNENSFNNFLYWNATRLTIENTCKSIIEREKWKRKGAVVDRCVSFYIDNITQQSDSEDISNNHSFPFWAQRTTTLLEDDDYFAPCHRDASSLVSKNSRVYLYSFDYEKTGLEGLTPYHAFDLVFYNGLHADDFTGKFDDRDREVGERYVNLFINFALYGHPTPWPVDHVTWTPLASPWSFNYLSIDTTLSMKNNYHEPSIWLWNWELPHIEDNVPMLIDGKKSFTADAALKRLTDSSVFNGKWIAVLAISAATAAIVMTVAISRWTNNRRSRHRESLLQNELTIGNRVYESLV